MKGPKPVQTPFSNTTTYQQITPTDTADTQALRGMQFQVDPGVSASFDSARRKIGETFDDPLGSYTTPAIREASERAAYGDLGQQEGAAIGEASHQTQALDLARKEDLAQMTAPRIVQSGSSGYGTQLVQQPSILNSAIGGASEVGAAAIRGAAI